jgi:hypothetical protein
MASIVEWQALRMQEYRYMLLAAVASFFELFGIRRPVRYEPRPAPAGDYDHAIHVDHPEAPSLLDGYLASPAQSRAVAVLPDGRKPSPGAIPMVAPESLPQGNGDEPAPEEKPNQLPTQAPGG